MRGVRGRRSKKIFAFFASVLDFSLVIEMIGIFDFLQWSIILVNSDVSPEFEIKIVESPFFIIPRSPWLASVGCKNTDGEPIDEKVDDIFEIQIFKFTIH